MKKIFLVFIILFLSGFAYSQDPLSIFVETSAGYSIGINIDGAFQMDLRMTTLLGKYGLMFEYGGAFSPGNPSFHLYLGPAMLVYSNGNWKIPLSIGFDIFSGNTIYYGFGAAASAQYKFSKYFYTGFNFGITYAFNNVINEVIAISSQGPKIVKKDRFGSYVYLRPSIVIGAQF